MLSHEQAGQIFELQQGEFSIDAMRRVDKRPSGYYN